MNTGLHGYFDKDPEDMTDEELREAWLRYSTLERDRDTVETERGNDIWAEKILRNQTSPYERQYEFARRLAFLDTPGNLKEEHLEQILKLLKRFRITPDDFSDLDEKPAKYGDDNRGYYVEGREWHFKLRQLRNRKSQEMHKVLLSSQQKLERRSSGA